MAMGAPELLADLLACVAAFSKSLEQSAVRATPAT